MLRLTTQETLRQPFSPTQPVSMMEGFIPLLRSWQILGIAYTEF